MKAILIFCVSVIFCLNTSAFNDSLLIQHTTPKEDSRFSFIPNFGLQLGSSYSQFSGYGSLFSQSITPTMTWSPVKNLRISAGAIISNFNTGSSSSFNDMAFGSSPIEGSILNNNFTSSMFFVAGSYDINQRLTISGAGYYDQNKASMMFYNPNTNFNNNEIKGMMLGLDYKISDNLRFGAEINISSGYNYMSPYNMSPFNQGFQNSSPFRRYNGW